MAALEDRSNWAYEALVFDGALALVALAAVSRALRTRQWGCCLLERGRGGVRGAVWACGASRGAGRGCLGWDWSCGGVCLGSQQGFSRAHVTIRGVLARWLTALKVAVVWLALVCPLVALSGDYSRWSVHLLDQSLQVLFLLVLGVCGTILSFRACGEGFWVRLSLVLALVSGIPRLASATSYGVAEERVAVWSLAIFLALYLALSAIPLTGVVRVLVPRSGEEAGAAGSGGSVVEEVGQGTLGWFKTRPGSASEDAPLLFQAPSSAIAGHASASAAAARLPPLEGDVSPVLSLYALRFAVGVLRVCGLALVGGKLAEEVEGGGGGGEWTWMQSVLPLVAASFVSTGAALAAVASMRTHDASRFESLAHLAAGAVVAVTGPGGPGVGVTLVLWGLHADDRWEASDVAFRIAFPALFQALLTALAICSVAFWFVCVQRPPFLTTALILTASTALTAILVSSVAAPASASALDASLSPEEADHRMALALLPALLLALLTTGLLLLLSEFVAPLPRGRWRPLRIDAIVPLGMGIGGAIAAAELGRGWRPTDGGGSVDVSVWAIMGCAIAAQSIAALHDFSATLLLALASLGCLGRPDVARGEQQVGWAAWLGEEIDSAAVFAVNRITGDAVSAFSRSSRRVNRGPTFTSTSTSTSTSTQPQIPAARLAAMQLAPSGAEEGEEQVPPGEEEAVVVIHSDGQDAADLFGIPPEKAAPLSSTTAPASVWASGRRGRSERDASTHTHQSSTHPPPSSSASHHPSSPARRGSGISLPLRHAGSLAVAAQRWGLRLVGGAAGVVRGAERGGKGFGEWSALEVAAWVEVSAGLPRYAPAVLELLAFGRAETAKSPGAGKLLLEAACGRGELVDTSGGAVATRKRIAEAIAISNPRHRRRFFSRLLALLPQRRRRKVDKKGEEGEEGERGRGGEGGGEGGGGEEEEEEEDGDTDVGESVFGSQAKPAPLPVDAMDPAELDAALEAVGSVGAASDTWGGGGWGFEGIVGGGGGGGGGGGEKELSEEERKARRAKARRERMQAALSRARALPRDWVWKVWLAEIGLPQLAEAFQRASVVPEDLIRGRLLRDPTVDGPLGLLEPRVRRSVRAGIRFLLHCGFDVHGEIAELRRLRWVPRPELPDHLPAWTNDDVVRWLIRVLPLDEDAHASRISGLRRSGLHGALLFRTAPFDASLILSGFGLSKDSATSALRERVETALSNLQEGGATAAAPSPSLSPSPSPSPSPPASQPHNPPSSEGSSEVGIGVASVLLKDPE